MELPPPYTGLSVDDFVECNEEASEDLHRYLTGMYMLFDLERFHGDAVDVVLRPGQIFQNQV